MPTAQHRKFDGGMNQDVASFLLGEGEGYGSTNILFDKIGIARKRGGIPGVGATTAYAGDHFGVVTKDDASAAFYMQNASSTAVSYVNTATGAMTQIYVVTSDALVNEGRPFSHYGFLIFPCFSSTFAAGAIAPAVAAGADGAVAGYSFTNPVTVTAGDKQMVCNAADNPLTHLQVGQIVVITGLLSIYVGRVTRLVSSTAFEVYPTPTSGLTFVVGSTYNAWSAPQTVATGQQATIGGKVGMSFQGRMLLGNISRRDTSGANRLEFFPRRVAFSSLAIENDTTGLGMQGAVYLHNQGFPQYNYFDIPGQDPLTAMSATGFGDAVFFSAFKTFRLTGNLSTQFGTQQSVTWTVREIPNSVGCMSERSVQRSPRGVIFAHDSGVYVTDGTNMRPLMAKRISNLWKNLVAANGNKNFVIYGSAILRGTHYYICGTSNSQPWGLLVNLDTLAWGQIFGKSNAPASWIINSSVQDPTDPGTIWGLKWFNVGGGAPSMTGGQLVKLDQMFNPSASNRADSDGTVVSWVYQTRPFHEDSPTIQKIWRQFTVEYKNVGGTNARVQPVSMLDGAEAAVAGGSLLPLPQQDVYTITNATNATPIVLTTSINHGIVADSWVHVSQVVGNTAANGPWRVASVTSNTITLLGSVGNANYISGGTVQAFDSRDFSLEGTIMQQVPDTNSSCIVYRFYDQGTPGADEFELWGIAHTWDERDPHSE